MSRSPKAQLAADREACRLALVAHRAPERAGDGEYLDLFFTVDSGHDNPVIAEPGKCTELVRAERADLPPDVIDYVAAALMAVDRGEPLLLRGWGRELPADHRRGRPRSR